MLFNDVISTGAVSNFDRQWIDHSTLVQCSAPAMYIKLFMSPYREETECLLLRYLSWPLCWLYVHFLTGLSQTWFPCVKRKKELLNKLKSWWGFEVHKLKLLYEIVKHADIPYDHWPENGSPVCLQQNRNINLRTFYAALAFCMCIYSHPISDPSKT